MKPVSQLLRSRAGTLWHVRPDDSVFTALQLLAQHEVGALVVMDGGRLVGSVSERVIGQADCAVMVVKAA